MAFNPQPSSERQQVAQRIAQFILDNDLTNPFGGDVTQSGDKKYYVIPFSRPRILNGLVRVYSPKFILIEMQGPVARMRSPLVFESEGDAVNFLRLAFVEFHTEAAMQVPTKRTKSP